jgi:hypothetical protein
MIRKLALIVILLFGISGCSTMARMGFSYDSANPGQVQAAGGQLQLLFSNPEYTDLNPNDPLAKSEMIQNQLYGKTNGSAFVTGGIGMMEVWRF